MGYEGTTEIDPYRSTFISRLVILVMHHASPQVLVVLARSALAQLTLLAGFVAAVAAAAAVVQVPSITIAAGGRPAESVNVSGACLADAAGDAI